MAEKPLDLLRSAHRTALGELELLEKASVALKRNEDAAWIDLDKVFGFFDGELKVHFHHEEAILFPYLARVIGREGPIAAMLDEHQSLWRTLDVLHEKVDELKVAQPDSAGKIALAVQQISSHIVGLLRSHIQKEDNILFPLAEEALDPETLREMVARINAVEAPV
ncbi:MAG: hemerythrin [Dehalococcoidia bacterium]|nr:hemerythrin [Dehalococcoidia bacterium]MBF8303851.1 hemerythrin [Dehalococcoidia bacterium]